MRLVDKNDNHSYRLADLKTEWATLRVQEPENHSESFQIELLEILMATVNDRNDLEIEGLTHREVSAIIVAIRTQI